MKRVLQILLFFSSLGYGQNTQVDDFKITILSTMLSDFHLGEWGFSALVEVDGERILFDTGSRAHTVIQNAEELKIDLNNIENVYLSHNHKDHTGGLISLRYPSSFSKAHVGRGYFTVDPESKEESLST